MWTRWFQIVVYLCVFGSVKTIHDSDFDFWYYVWLCGCGWGSDEIGLWCDLCYSYWTMMETCGCPKKVQKYRHFFFSCFVLYRPVVDDRIMKCVEIMYCSFIYIYIILFEQQTMRVSSVSYLRPSMPGFTHWLYRTRCCFISFFF